MIGAAAYGFAGIKPHYPIKKLVEKPKPKELVDLKADDVVHPITDDQIISVSNITGFISKTMDALLDKILDDKKPSSFKKVSYTPRTYTPYSWTATKHDDGYLQPSGMTKEERYPKIYDAAVKMKPKAKRVLSFGCSTGEEVFALAKRFPNADQLIGVDIDHNRVRDARRANKQKNVYFHDTVGGLGQFDVVTALNVFFCLDKPIPKDQWQKTLEEVAGYVAPGGMLMIFKSDYDPIDILKRLEFKAENIWNHTHNRNNKDYFCGYYRKKSRWW